MEETGKAETLVAGEGGIFYRERPGALPAVLCVHGFLQSSIYWAPTLDRLASLGVRAIAPDLPGFGESAAAPGPYTVQGHADRLAELADSLGLAKVVLVGGSMGGIIAQHFALRHPERLERLLLVATGPGMVDPAAALAKADALAASPWVEETVRPTVEGFFHRRPSEAEMVEYRRIALSASQSAAVEAHRSSAGSNTLESLGKISVPTLIVHGRHDRARPPAVAAGMRDRIPGARLVVMEDVGHTLQLEDPETFYEAAIPFLLGRG